MTAKKWILATVPGEGVIDHKVHGLLAGFDDVDTLAEQALRVLRAPEGYRHLGRAARACVMEGYEAGHCIGQLVRFFEEVVQKDTVGQFFAQSAL